MVYLFRWSVIFSLSNGGSMGWKVSKVTNPLFSISKSSWDNFDYSSSFWSNKHVYMLPYREEALIIGLIHTFSRSWVQIFVETKCFFKVILLIKKHYDICSTCLHCDIFLVSLKYCFHFMRLLFSSQLIFIRFQCQVQSGHLVCLREENLQCVN